MTCVLLEDNLREIEAANFLDRELVPNYSGSRVYQRNSYIGRIWSFFFSIFRKFSNSGIEKEALFRAMRKTESAFKECVQSVKSACLSYKTYLDLRYLNVPINEVKYHEAREKILNWNRFAAPLIKKYIAGQKDISNPLLATLSDEIEKQDFSIKEPRLYKKLINLEGALQEPIPWPLFKSLKEGKPLGKKENASLNAWIKRYNTGNSPLTIGRFHDCLKAFCEIVPGPITLIELESKLENLGLHLFIQPDSFHLEWRKSLNKGSILQTSKGKIVLGEFLPEGHSDQSNNWVFAIDGDPNKVVVVGINRSVQDLKKRLQEREGAVIPSARLLEIAPSGKFAIYQRLYDSLESQTWKSTSKNLEKEDLKALWPVIRWIQWMIKQNSSPTRLEPKHLMFNTEGYLTSAKVCKSQEFSHTLIEDFILKASKQNKWVFSCLIEKSGLHDLPASSFYSQVFERALKGKPLDSKFSNGFNITDPRVVDRGNAFYKQVIELQESCKNAILEKYDVSERDLKLLETIISSFFRTSYQKLKCCGVLWSGIRDQVISMSVKKGGWKVRAS